MTEKSINRLILAISIAVPLLVTIIFYSPAVHLNIDLSFLPKFHAILNSSVALLLVAGLYFIKNKNIKAHKICMMTAFSLSALFLLSYVLYHSTHEETHYGNTGAIKYVYYILLISHILLAIIIMPFILITLSRALTQKYDKHKKIARITWPLWLYVSVTGVIVYFMIAPFYPQ